MGHYYEKEREQMRQRFYYAETEPDARGYVTYLKLTVISAAKIISDAILDGLPIPTVKGLDIYRRM